MDLHGSAWDRRFDRFAAAQSGCLPHPEAVGVLRNRRLQGDRRATSGGPPTPYWNWAARDREAVTRMLDGWGRAKPRHLSGREVHHEMGASCRAAPFVRVGFYAP